MAEQDAILLINDDGNVSSSQQHMFAGPILNFTIPSNNLPVPPSTYNPQVLHQARKLQLRTLGKLASRDISQEKSPKQVNNYKSQVVVTLPTAAD